LQQTRSCLLLTNSFGDPTKPVGGNVVAHTSTYRVYLKKSGKKRIARMVDSPHHPEMDVIFALGEAGVIDPDSETKKKKTTKKSEPKEEVPETPDVSAEPLDSEPKEEVPETPDVSAEPLDSESADLE